MQAAAWMVCTTAAFLTARNRQIVRAPPVDGPLLRGDVHLCLQPLFSTSGPAYWSHLGDAFWPLSASSPSRLPRCFSWTSGLNWRELTTVVTDGRPL